MSYRWGLADTQQETQSDSLSALDDGFDDCSSDLWHDSEAIVSSVMPHHHYLSHEFQVVNSGSLRSLGHLRQSPAFVPCNVHPSYESLLSLVADLTTDLWDKLEANLGSEVKVARLTARKAATPGSLTIAASEQT